MKPTKIYELITPSDPITFRAASHAVAFFCAVNLGRGKAACTCEDGTDVPSMMLFMDEASIDARLSENLGGMKITEFVEANRAEIVAAFRSFAYGSVNDRRDYDAALEAITDKKKLKAFKAYHEDNRRTSMSRWVAAAWERADEYEGKPVAGKDS